MSSVTLQSIADALGVSRTTISNAYNRPDQLTGELRDRILATADNLGYSGPNVAARNLRIGRRNAVGVVFTEDLRYVFHDPDTSAFLSGVAETTATAGTGVMLLPVPPGTDPAKSAVPHAAVDGYILYSIAGDHPVLEHLAHRRGPLVVVDEPDRPDIAGFIGIDDRAGSILAAEHLLGLGHTRIGIITGRLGVKSRPGPVDMKRRSTATVRVARNRFEGNLQAIGQAGLDCADVPMWEAAGNDPDSGRVAAVDLLTRHPELTGVLCFSDRIAIGACQAARRLGIGVPSGISVVGFDDIPRATTWDPPLTTVRQPLVEKGRLAARMLLDAVDGKSPVREILDISLQIRESTASPRQSGRSD